MKTIKYNGLILKTKNIYELNRLEDILIESYGQLYTKNNFLESINKQRDVLYCNC